MIPVLCSPTKLALPLASTALKSLSASRLSCWQQCRRKHFFRYVAQLPSESSAAQLLGKVVHAVLQRVNHWRWAKKSFQAEDCHLALEESWEKLKEEEPVNWKDDQEEPESRNKARDLVDSYLSSGLIRRRDPIAGVEVRLEAELDGLPPLIGILDLVYADGRIVDYKTAAKSPSSDSAAHQHGTQLGIYALLYRHCSGRKESGLELHHLIKTKVPKVEVTAVDTATDEVIEGTLELMHRHVSAVQAGDFTSSPPFLCSSCEYLAECRAWPTSRERVLEGGVA